MKDATQAAIMGTRRVGDLVVWQLANELREKVHAITANRPAFDDRRFRDQIRDSASSVTRNVAEGFGRYKHREFAQFLVIGRGSLFELSGHLHDGAVRGYWTEPSIAELQSLCRRTIAATTHLILYLRSHPDV